MVPLYYGAGRSLRNHFDDAYITYRFAIQLARGHGLVFNVGERIDAASSFLYAVLLAGLYRIGLHDLELAAVEIGALCAGGIAAVVFGTLQRLTGRPWLAAVMGLFAGANGLISGWAASGMESVFYAFLVVFFVGSSFFRHRENWVTAAALCFIVLTRVEGLIVGFAWGSMHCIRMARERGLGEHDSRANRAFLLHGALAATTTLGFFAFKYCYYGTLLPHTFHLKLMLRVYHSNPSDLLRNWVRVASVAVSLAVVGAVVLAWQQGTSAVLGTLIFLALTGVSCALGPNAGWARYSIQALPPVMILAGVAIHWLLAKPLKVICLPVAAMVLFGVGIQTVTSCTYMRDNLRAFSPHQDCRRKVGDYLRDHVDPSEVIVSTDIGEISYEAMDFSFIDTVGLTSEDVYRAYQEGRSLDVVFDRRHPRFAADTWWPLGQRRRGEYKAYDKVVQPGRMLTRSIPVTHYAANLQDRGVLYQCLNSFAVGPIGRP